MQDELHAYVFSNKRAICQHFVHGKIWQVEVPQMFSFNRLLQDAVRLYLIDKHTLFILNKQDGKTLVESDVPAGLLKDGVVINYSPPSTLQYSGPQHTQQNNTLVLLSASTSGRELQFLRAKDGQVFNKIPLKEVKLRVVGQGKKGGRGTRGGPSEEESVILFRRDQIDDSLFLFSQSSGDLACLDHAGEEKWRYPLPNMDEYSR